MRHLPSALFLAVFLVLALLCGGCTFTDSLSEVACDEDSDCERNQRCGAEGYCVLIDLADIGAEELPCNGACIGDELCDETTNACVCPGPNGTSEPSCGEGSSCCAGSGCVVLLESEAHCGACGTACGEGESCVEGACQCGELVAAEGAACELPRVCCDGRCADPRFDTQCCGTLEAHTDCGTSFCQNGACVCPAGFATCGDAADCATNIIDDPAHCGECGASCGTLACIGGGCSCGGIRCLENETCCELEGASSCVDFDTDPLNCSDCGIRCGAGETCVAGDCRCAGAAACTDGNSCCAGACRPDDDPLCRCGDTACTASQPDCCDEVCVDVGASAEHCGACGSPCGDAQNCIGGRCFCDDPALTNCDGSCVDVLTTDAHCGACGEACGDGQTCCSGQCKDLATDLLNCGTCGSFCGGESCVGGQCSCGGTPVNLDIDPSNCGECGNQCGRANLSGAGCIAGACRYESAMCTAGFADCNGDLETDGCEVNLASNNAHCGGCGNACPSGQVCIASQCQGTHIVELALGDDFSCARRQNGEVLCWGKGEYGRLGTNSVNNLSAPGVAVTDESGATLRALDITAGITHACAVRDNNEVWCWGHDNRGELALSADGDRLRAVKVTLGGPASRVAAHVDHTCAIVDRSAAGGAAGEVWCWGRAEWGRLGNGSESDTEVRTPVRAGTLTGAVDLTAGDEHTCAVTTAGIAWCWGQDNDGRLADGNTNNTNRTTPTQVTHTASAFAQIEAGDVHTVAVDTAGVLWGWGLNDLGQLLGQGGEPPKNLGSGYARVASGYGHTCAITSPARAVVCFGLNNEGQLGNNSTSNSSTTVTPQGLTGGVVFIDVGDDHSCAALASGGVKCWGDNGYGQLGRNNTDDSRVPVDVVGLP